MLKPISIGDLFLSRKTQRTFTVSDIRIEGQTSYEPVIQMTESGNEKNSRALSVQNLESLLSSKDGLERYEPSFRVLIDFGAKGTRLAKYQGESVTGVTIDAANRIARELCEAGLNADVAQDPQSSGN